ncbi:PREDICTED: xylosyltransferase oxt isoform X2 [Nicrophorus vespilloides]|nr:PREDICTED: xylosyltransferase oxt isoform X2 [Nicrophorus vespilloides]
MVVIRTVDNRWIKRYRIFFGIVGIIVLVQLYLSSFKILADSDGKENKWNPHKISGPEDAENSVNSARRGKDSLAVDDEDARQDKVQKSSNKQGTKSYTKLRIEELDFKPSCEITTKEAISAIHRAKTQKCKQEISNLTCLIQNGLFYPTVLPNYCPNDDLIAGKSLGCFKDEKSFRILRGYYANFKNNNSPENCIRLCLQSGFPYAGVQYSTECFCGIDEPPSVARLPDSSCNMKCPANHHLACGGYFTINVYQTGIKKFYPQVATIVSTDPKPVKIVFLLTLNGRALRQVKRLIKTLYNVNHYFYIHVDVRQDYLFRELLSLEKQFPNIRLTRKRYATIWGGASLLKMLLSCMKELLHLDWKWDFVLNLSESDYPVKTVNRLVEFLGANMNRNFVKSHGREVQRFIQKQGLDKTFIECDTHMWRTGDRQLPWGIQIDGGSDWIALSRKFVNYVASDYPDQLVEGLLVFFKYTLLPAESFFHTVLRNSKFCGTYVDNNLHVTNWKRRLGCKCQYKHVVDWCGCSPNDFKPEDWLRIQNTQTRQLFFARKFEPIINQAVVVQLEEWLYSYDFSKSILNINSYWHSIYNALDLGQNVDDSVISISNSAIRSKFRSLKCNNDLIKIKEIHTFHVSDSYNRTLVLFEATSLNSSVVSTYELGFRPRKRLVVKKSPEFPYRLENLVVSSEYDQKEQISRNFGKMLGPYSEPTLIYHFSSVSSPEPTKVANISFLWIDPGARLIEISEVSIEDGYTIGHIKPNLKQPLLPGSWTLKMIHKSSILAEVKFLVTPLSHISNNLVSQSQVSFIHGGSELFKEYDGTLDKFLPGNNQRESLEMLSISNSKRFGQDLLDWIDALFGKFYTLESICIASAADTCGLNVTKCSNTNWSSLAPDPKSHIGKINETTGSFDLW